MDIASLFMPKVANTTYTQTEEFMFPMDEELKKKVMDLIGGKLPKYGDQYDKGSAFFTKNNLILDELEAKYELEIDIEARRKVPGINAPKDKQFIPVLTKLKKKSKD